MKKLILLVLVSLICSGCSRSFWSPNWDKAETEKKQLNELQKQTKALERIAEAIEKIKE